VSLELKDAEISMPPSTYTLFQQLSKKQELSDWTLVGGTALSLYLHHRTSEDLDLFIEENVLSKKSLRSIDAIISDLEASGVGVLLEEEDQYLRDYQIAGIKVTFFASSLKSLKKDPQHLGRIDIASINTIAAMKIESIIKYRTVTRDFFDVYSLWQIKKMDLYDQISNYHRFYAKNTSTELMEKRLFERAVDINKDPGFKNISTSRPLSVKEIRESLLEWVIDTSQKESQVMKEAIAGKTEDLEVLRFGMSRMSLLQKLCTFGEDDKVIELLEEGQFDLSYESLDGRTLLDYYQNDRFMQEKVASNLIYIPGSWLDSKRYAFDQQTLALLLYQNSVIIQAKNPEDVEKLTRVAKKKEYDVERFIDDVIRKSMRIDYGNSTDTTISI